MEVYQNLATKAKAQFTDWYDILNQVSVSTVRTEHVFAYSRSIDQWGDYAIVCFVVQDSGWVRDAALIPLNLLKRNSGFELSYMVGSNPRWVDFYYKTATTCDLAASNDGAVVSSFVLYNT